MSIWQAALTRREFLRAGSLSLLGLMLPIPRTVHITLTDNRQYGRVVETTLPLYQNPSHTAELVKYLWKDVVLPITAITVGDGDPPYNRIWYRLGDQGYAHSGSIQPVRILPQASTGLQIPPEGQLAEVTVPFTDTRLSPEAGADTVCRLYYATTHWAISYSQDESGEGWYGITDDKLKQVYYAQARHLRLVPDDELKPISPQVPAEEKRIEVQLDHQLVVAYEYDQPVFMARAATGARFSSGNYSTDPGRYVIDRKRPGRHMAAGDRAAPNSYDLPGVPWICYFTEDGISFHGTFWHNDFGKPRSHGCINLSPASAKWIYLWTHPVVSPREHSLFANTGTIVDVI